MDKEKETLINEILNEIMSMPEDKQVEAWNIIRYFSSRKETAQNG